MSVTCRDLDEAIHDAEHSLVELIHFGAARAAVTLSDLIGIEIQIEIRTEPADSSAADGVEHVPGSMIRQSFDGPAAGQAALVLSDRSGLLLAQQLVRRASPVSKLDVELRSVLLEVGNIVLNSVLGSLSTRFHRSLQYSVPELTSENLLSGWQAHCDQNVADVRVAFCIGGHVIDGTLRLESTRGSLQELASQSEPCAYA